MLIEIVIAFGQTIGIFFKWANTSTGVFIAVRTVSKAASVTRIGTFGHTFVMTKLTISATIVGSFGFDGDGNECQSKKRKLRDVKTLIRTQFNQNYVPLVIYSS